MQELCYAGALLVTTMCCLQDAGAQLPVTNNRDSVPRIQFPASGPYWRSVKNLVYQNPDHRASTGLFGDAGLTDTAGKQWLPALRRAGGAAVRVGTTSLYDATHAARQVWQQQLDRYLSMQAVKGLVSQLRGNLKQPILQWEGGAVCVSGQMSMLNNVPVFSNSSLLSGNGSVLGIPIGMQWMRQDANTPENASRTVVSFRFDREAYLQSLRNKIKQTIDPGDLLPVKEALQQIGADALQKLRLSPRSLNDTCQGLLTAYLSQWRNRQDVVACNDKALCDTMLAAGCMHDIENMKNRLCQLEIGANSGDSISQPIYDSLLRCVQLVNAINNSMEKIGSFKEAMQKVGLLHGLQQAGPLWAAGDTLEAVAGSPWPVSGLQKLLLNLRQFRAGMNTVSLSPLSQYQYANVGINAAFVRKSNYLFVMAGRQKEYSRLAGQRSADNKSLGLRIGRGEMENDHSHFSIFRYAQQEGGDRQYPVAVLPGRTVVLAFSNQVKLDEANTLRVEVSKSAHRYNNQEDSYGGVPDTVRGAGQHFMQQLAFTVQWKGAIPNRDLSYDLDGTRTGKGYNNPGSSFLPAGMTALNGSFKKGLLQGRLQLLASANYRAYNEGGGHSAWRDYNFSFQGRLTLQKGQYIAVRYQPARSFRWQDNKKYAMAGSHRLQLDMNLRRRFGVVQYQHTVSLFATKDKYGFNGLPSLDISVSSMQTIAINKLSCYLQAQYNKGPALSLPAMFNTQFNADAGMMYAICRRIASSTALLFNSAGASAQLLGIKQSFSGQLGQGFTTVFYAAMLRCVGPCDPTSLNNSRLDWSLQYVLR
jgi:hypothetical protein